MDFWTDPLILAAGNARGLVGGDPMRMPGSPRSGAIPGRGIAPGVHLDGDGTERCDDCDLPTGECKCDCDFCGGPLYACPC